MMYATNRVVRRNRNGLGEWDFSTAISDIAKSWVSVEQAKAARDAAKYQAQANQIPFFPTSGGTSTGISTNTILLMAAAGLALYLILKK